MPSERPFTQFELDKWPSGKSQSIAVIRLEPPELARRYGLTFSEGYDDLYYFTEAAVQLPSGQPLLLVRHREHPAPGTEIRVDADDDPQRAREELLRALGMDSSVFTWLPNEEEPPSRRR